jgi:hypothetical protein
MASICITIGYKIHLVLDRKVYTKARAFVEKIDYILQRQIVKATGKQIDTEDS